MRHVATTLLVLLVSGCGSTWTGVDGDGDGFTLAQGDCDDGPDGGGVGPEATEVWYDGVDQDCDGNDADQDLDGEPALLAGGLDCWDDPTSIPAEFSALNGLVQPEAGDVLPGAPEVYYDGVDQDCDGADDFDQDGDGFASTAWVETRTELPVEDCYDAVTQVYPELWPDCVVEANRVVETPLSPAAVFPDASDTWYDGTDANCDGDDDFDKDGDTFAVCAECDDDDPTVFPNDAVELWYNHLDENCDGNDADQDGDGYVVAGYVEADPGNPIHVEGAYGVDDCWDDPADIPRGYDAINGMAQPSAAAVHPDAIETWYDGVDEDCASDDDFDQDGDGDPAETEPNRSGLFGSDCNDLDGTIYSDAPETWYDGTDSDCDGGSDYDQDADGYDSAAYSYGTSDDCDDTKSEVHPSTAGDFVNEDCATTYDDDCDGDTNDDDAESCVEHYDDADVDGYGDVTDSRCLCTDDGTYTTTGVTTSNDDCDDTRAAVNPAVTIENCGTSYDDDCDAVTNEQNGTSCTTYYLDADGDSYGTTTSQCWCSGYGTYDASNDDDCDDTRAAVSPAVTNENCSTSYDDDCDGVTNEQNGSSCTTYYYDGDNDAFGNASLSQCWCSTSGSYDVTNDDDCDDADATTFPGVAEEDSTTACMSDADGDGFGDTTAPSGGTAGTDCDDARSGVNPDGTETCGTAYDDDCDSSTNDTGAVGCTTYYYDGDNDTYGKSTLSQCTCTTSGSYDVTNSTDCDDSDADTFPGAASVESVTSCRNDDDNDGYGDTTVTSGVTAGTDCDDTRSAVNTAATETCSTTYDDDCDSSTNDVGATGCTTYYYDGDNDGYAITTSSQCTCTSSGNYDITGTTSANDDCDDTDDEISPGDPELCTTTADDDCDGGTNDVGATGCTTYFYDGDADGYGITTSSQCTCTSSGLYTVAGVTSANDDCDDTLAAVSPGDAEVCATTYDDDCDGSSNEVDASDCTTYYYDADSDGYGLLTTSQCACASSGSYTVTGTTSANDDCDDTRATVSPADLEVCSTTYDDDCDGSSNEVGASDCTTYYYDGDSDGYGLLTTTQCACGSSGSYTVTGVTAANDDCDDTRAAVSPADPEVCSTTYDDDCDGSSNEAGAADCTTYYYDGDNDTYGDANLSTCTCATTGSYDTTDATDCDDAVATTYPGAADTFATNDGVDNDCDEFIDETGVAYGDIVITEFFGGNLTATYDWVEIYNNSGDTISLANWTMDLCHDADSGVAAPYVSGDCSSWVTVTFPSSATVADDSYYVVCDILTSFTTATDCDLVLTSYDSPAYTTSTDLENMVGGVEVALDGTLIDSVFWWQDNGNDDWPADGSTTVTSQLTSIQLDLDTITAVTPDPADANDDYSTSTSNPYLDDVWCTSEDALVSNDWASLYTIVGTPGAVNVDCP
ncbi:MAG: lamin tail domain-containing protein [Myxococcales bacterium]|nr:lamin tail domain-containing protein [Myxococcales bacterium]